MLDQFGRNIDYIRISVTDRCNLRCRYCMPECGVEAVPHSEILNFDEILRLTEVFASLGIRKVKLTGGEPLVRRGIVDLIRQMKVVPGIDEITMTTNGVLIGQKPELAQELADAGISGINISLDTLKQERYEVLTGTDGLEDVRKAIDTCCMVPGLKVKVNAVTLAEYNRDEVRDLAKLAKDRRLDVRFIELMPVGLGRNFGSFRQDWILNELEQAYGTVREETERKEGNGPAVYYRLDGFCGKIGFISALSHQFCGDCNRVRLTSEGFLKPCLQYRDGVDLKALLRSGVSDETLREAIAAGIYGKPRQHEFCSETSGNEEGKEEKNMSFIGG